MTMRAASVLLVPLMLSACVFVTSNEPRDAGNPYASDAALDGWTGTYDGPILVIDQCTGAQRTWALTITVTSFGTVVGLCDLPIEPTGEDTARLLESECAYPARRARGWARRDGRAIVLDGITEKDCGQERWIYSGLRQPT